MYVLKKKGRQRKKMAPSPWVAHVRAFAKANGISYAEAQQQAGVSYKKKTTKKGGSKKKTGSKKKRTSKKKTNKKVASKPKTTKKTSSKKKASKKKGVTPPHLKKWIAHVTKYARDNNLKLGDAMKPASKTYNKR